LLIGSKHGPYHEELKNETKKLGLEDKVFFTEMRSDIPQILNISDIVIVPPTLEVSLYSIMEAMASFKPVIATQIGGIPEVVADGKTGILFPKGDVDTLTKAVNYLISNPETRRRMGSLGRRIVEEKFNLNRHVEEFLDLYEELLQLKNLD